MQHFFLLLLKLEFNTNTNKILLETSNGPITVITPESYFELVVLLLKHSNPFLLLLLPFLLSHFLIAFSHNDSVLIFCILFL